MFNITRLMNNSSRHCETLSIGLVEKCPPKQSCSHSQNRKRAAITIELALAISLAIVALFALLGLFGNNLKNMIAASNMQRMFAYNPAKTATVKLAADPTATQVNVQVVASQGLQWYLDNAQAAIAKYKANPPDPNDQSAIEDLAKQATIAKIGNTLSKEDKILLINYGISINISGVGENPGDGYKTTIKGTKNLYFNGQNADPNVIPYSPDVQLSIIKEVTGKNFN